MARKVLLCSVLLCSGLLAAGEPGDIEVHSTLEAKGAKDLREAQEDVKTMAHIAKASARKKPEDWRSESVMHLAESAKAALAAQRDGAESPQPTEEEAEEDQASQGIPGLGRMVQPDDPNLAHVEVMHVDHLPPHKVQRLRKAVGQMQNAVLGGRDARDVAAVPAVAAAVAPDAPVQQSGSAAGMGPAARAVAERRAAVAASSQTIAQTAKMHDEFKAKMESHAVNMHQALDDHAKEIEEERLAKIAAVAKAKADAEKARLEAAKAKADAERRRAEDAALRLHAAEVAARMKKELEVKQQLQAQQVAEAQARASAQAKITEEQKAKKEKEDAAKDEAHKKLVEYRTQQKANREKKEKSDKAQAQDRTVQQQQAMRDAADQDRVTQNAAKNNAPLAPNHHSGATSTGRLVALIAAGIAAAAACHL